MSPLPLLVNISVALAYALIGGLVARRLRLPTIVGYMLAGVAIGPVTPGFRGDPDAIHQFAEFGVILLMFGVGLHFSFRDLWAVRRVAVPGALAQMAVIAGAGWLAARAWGFSPGGAWILGIALSVASTVVAIRALMDRGWLDTPAGHMTVGWLVFEDLATVVVLVLLPALTSTSSGSAGVGPAAIAVAKAIAFVLVMAVVGTRALPFLLTRIAGTRSRELFVLMALTVAIGIALGASYVFGVSLALGAFVAGLVVSETPFSHQIAADLLPFREAFAVIFFVSVGMLVDPAEIAAHWGRVLAVSAIIVGGKTAASIVAGAALRLPARTSLVVAASRAQIGEFSFIVGQAGLALALITDSQYSLILAGAIVSITINPAVLWIVGPIERRLPRHPAIWRIVDRGAVDAAPPVAVAGHVVIVGCGRVGRHIAETLGRLDVPRLVIEADPARLTKLRELGVPVLYGDAANSDILEHAALDRARALVITLPDDAAALTIVATARKMAPGLPTIVRASTWDGARRLREAGAMEVVRPELEGGVEIVRRTLLELALPTTDVQRYLDAVRREGLEESARPSPERARVLDDLVHAARHLELQWITLESTSAAAGRTIAETALRSRTGASIVAIGRGEALLPNPDPAARLQAGDRIAMIGTGAQTASATRALRSSRD